MDGPGHDGRPKITDYDVRYRAVGAPQWISLTLLGVGFSATLQGLEPGTSYSCRWRRPRGGPGPVSDTGFGRTQGGNRSPRIDPPEDGGDRRCGQVTENAPAGAPVGAPITATDVDGDALTYTLFGANAFVIDAASGQIRVAGGAVRDYETHDSYAVTVRDGRRGRPRHPGRVDRRHGGCASPRARPRAPAKPDAPAVAPSAAAPTTALDVTWTAPANAGQPAITDYDVRTGGGRGRSGPRTTSWREHHRRFQISLPTLPFEVQVAASNVGGLGPWSDAGTGRTSSPDDSDGPDNPDGPDTRTAPDNPDNPDGPDRAGQSGPVGQSGRSQTAQTSYRPEWSQRPQQPEWPGRSQQPRQHRHSHQRPEQPRSHEPAPHLRGRPLGDHAAIATAKGPETVAANGGGATPARLWRVHAAAGRGSRLRDSRWQTRTRACFRVSWHGRPKLPCSSASRGRDSSRCWGSLRQC